MQVKLNSIIKLLSSKSREKMLMILPTGVESKKRIGQQKILTNNLSWIALDARRHVYWKTVERCRFNE
jgi:hypothetical protein